MAIFIGVHDMGEPMNEEEFKKNWEHYKEACKKRGAEAHKVFYNAGAGKAFCVTEAASADDVKEAHEELGVPPEDIVEVQKLK